MRLGCAEFLSACASLLRALVAAASTSNQLHRQRRTSWQHDMWPRVWCLQAWDTDGDGLISTEDFHDRVKSLSNGFASLDYEPAGFQVADIVVLGLRINGEDVDALSRIVRRQHALPLAREMVSSMKAESARTTWQKYAH